MKKFLMICAAAATLGAVGLASTEASANHRHHGGGWGGGYGGGWGGGYGGGYGGDYGWGDSGYGGCEWTRIFTPHGYRWRCV